jgi:hypothetical protein
MTSATTLPSVAHRPLIDLANAGTRMCGPLVDHVHDLSHALQGVVGDVVGARVSLGEDLLEVARVGGQLAAASAQRS